MNPYYSNTNINIFKFIADFISDNGLLTTLFVVVIFIAVILLKTRLNNIILDFFKKIFNTNVKKNKEKDNPSNSTKVEVRESDITNHEIFNLIDFWVYSKIPTLDLSTEFRNAVFKKYLHIYFSSYKNILHVYTHSAKYKELDNSELRNDLLDTIYDIVFDYESEMSRSGIPQIIINKMKEKNNEALKLKMELVNSICESNFYNSERNLLKVYSFLNIILSILENTLSHCEEVSKNINGELKGMTFNGFTEP